MNHINENEVIENEERLRRAMIDSNVAELDQLLSADLIFTNHLGHVMTKSDDLEGHAKGDLKIADIVLSDSKVKLYGHIAIVSVAANITGTYKGSAANGQFRFSRVWQKHNGDLQVIAGHSCIIA